MVLTALRRSRPTRSRCVRDVVSPQVDKDLIASFDLRRSACITVTSACSRPPKPPAKPTTLQAPESQVHLLSSACNTTPTVKNHLPANSAGRMPESLLRRLDYSMCCPPEASARREPLDCLAVCWKFLLTTELLVGEVDDNDDDVGSWPWGRCR